MKNAQGLMRLYNANHLTQTIPSLLSIYDNLGISLSVYCKYIHVIEITKCIALTCANVVVSKMSIASCKHFPDSIDALFKERDCFVF